MVALKEPEAELCANFGATPFSYKDSMDFDTVTRILAGNLGNNDVVL